MISFIKRTSTSLFFNKTLYYPFLCYITQTMDNILKPPDTVGGMTELNKAAFEKDIVVPFVSIEKVKLSRVMPLVKRCLLKLENLKPVQHLPEGDVDILLNPQQIRNWASFTETERKDLFDVSVTENDFKERTLTLKYDNYSAEDILRAVLPQDKEGMSSFTKVGHIVHVNLREHLLPFKNVIATVLFDKVPGCRSVVNKTNMIDNTYRNFSMEVLKGEENMLTTVKENNCTFQFDFSTVYWNSRLCTEHERIVEKLQGDDVLFDVFAGVGPFSVPAAKRKCLVYANDLNPESYKWLNKNFKNNKVNEAYFKTFNMDGRDFIKQVIRKHIPGYLKGDKHVYITMNLPAMAVEFLEELIGLLNPEDVPETFIPPIVFIYCFAKGENPLEISKKLISDHVTCDISDKIIEIFKVRTVSSMKEMMRVTIKLDRDILVGSVRKRKFEVEVGNSSCNKKIIIDSEIVS